MLSNNESWYVGGTWYCLFLLFSLWKSREPSNVSSEKTNNFKHFFSYEHVTTLHRKKKQKNNRLNEKWTKKTMSTQVK